MNDSVYATGVPGPLCTIARNVQYESTLQLSVRTARVRWKVGSSPGRLYVTPGIGDASSSNLRSPFHQSYLAHRCMPGGLHRVYILPLSFILVPIISIIRSSRKFARMWIITVALGVSEANRNLFY